MEMRACEECCRNCQLAHGKRKDLSPSVSRFINIYIGDDISNFLRVPLMYTNTISHLVGKDVKLEDSTGAQFKVSLSNYMGVLVFNKGWAKFAADHKLQVGDILVFHYFNFSHGHFVVHIVDRTLVERTEFAKNIHPGKYTMTTEKNVVDRTPSQRSVDHSSRQARQGRNLINARTNSEMGDGDNDFTDIEKTAADMTPFQGNATEGVRFTHVGSSKKPRTNLEMGEGDGVGFRDIGIGRHSKQARTGLEMGDGDKGATKGVSRKVGRPSKQGRTSLEMGDGDNDAIDTEKIAAVTTSFQGNATKVGRPSKQARADRNLVNANSNLEMGCEDIRTTDTSEARRESSSTSFPIESNIETPLDQPSASYGPLQPKSVNEERPYLDVAAKSVSSRNIGCPSKLERTDRNLDNAKTCLELDAGDIRTADTSEFNRESSRTSFPIESNFKIPLIQPSTSFGILQPKSGNVEQPCLDDASCVIIDRSTYFAENEKKVALYDLSVYERQIREPISDKSCIDGEEGTHTRTQKFEASMAEANNSSRGFINRKTVSKVHNTGMVQDTKASGHMNATGIFPDTKTSVHKDTTGMVQGTKASGHMDATGMFPDTKTSVHKDTTGMVQDTKASGQTDTTGMVQDTKASGQMGTTGNCRQSPLGRGNGSKSPMGNAFDSPIPSQGMASYHTMDTRKEMKVVKKEQVPLREEASAHLRKQDQNPSWEWKADGPSTSSLKRKAAKLEPVDSLDEPALFPDSITCSAVTDNCDYVKLPARLPSVAFKKARGRIDNRCSILLIDPEKRKWPAIYLDNFGSFFGVICGWKQFNEANKVHPGDSYVFSLDNKSECWFKVDVVRT